MIPLTRLNRAPMVLNSDLIEHIDVTPDTVITLTTGQILRVRETAEEVIRRIIDYRRQIFCPDGFPSDLVDNVPGDDASPSPARLEAVARGGPRPERLPGASAEDSEDRN